MPADEGRGLATLFLRNRHLLVLTVVTILVAGFSAMMQLPRIEDPRITNRNAIILTLLPGASAARVEALVTNQLEDRLEEVAEIKRIESTSRPGVSLLSIELKDSIDRDINEVVFSKIRGKLADAEPALPASASKPEFDDKRGAVAFSLITAIRLSGPGESRLGILKRLAEELADRLRALPGTEIVRLYGAPGEEITVTLDAGELAALGLSASEVSARVAAADAKQPAGVLRTPTHDVLMEIAGELDSVQRVMSIPLARNTQGALVKLGDIGQASKGWQEPPRELAFANGQRAVWVAARVEADVRLDRWARTARSVVQSFADEVGGDIDISIAFDQSRYTEARLGNLGRNLLAGAAVVVAVVLVGMGWRAALIVGAALPLSAAAALFGLTFFGQQIHQMTIFGMIIAIGLLIDNAIVVTDEVRKRMRAGLNPRDAVGTAVRHLFTPLLASTTTTILGFMPIFLLPGNVGDFVGPIAISVVLALAASFVISMTVIAALAARFAPPVAEGHGRHWWRDGLASRRLATVYRKALTWSLQHPSLAIALSLILPALGFLLASTLGNQFFPPADRDQFEIEVWHSSDASIHRSAHVAQQVEQVMRNYQGIERVDWLVGGSFPSVYYNLIMDKDNDPRYAHGIVLVDSVERMNTLIPELQTELDARFPEAQIVLRPFGQGPPYEAPVAFRITGPHLDKLKAYGDALRRILYTVPEILHTQATVLRGEPKLSFQADEDEARLTGLTLSGIAGQFDGNLEGQQGGSVLEDVEQLPVRIRYGVQERQSLDRIASLNLVSGTAVTSDAWIPAEALGDMVLEPELSTITRRDGERVNTVLAYVTQGTLPIEVTREVVSRLEDEDFVLAPGYHLEVAGDREEQGRAVGQLLTYVPVLVMLMVTTLVLAFRSAVLAGVIGAVGALCIGLGMLSLWISGFPLGFNPILGTAGLVGVAINGSIVVLAAIRANPQARAGDSGAIIEEAVGTTRHILSTTLTTIGGFAPLLLLTTGDFWPPLAAVIAGGVGFSVILSLLFTPALYRLIYGMLGARSKQPTRPALAGS